MDYWKQLNNGLEYKYISTDLNMLVHLRILSSGNPTDSLDYVVYIYEDYVRLYFRQICNDIIEMYDAFNIFATQHELKRYRRNFPISDFRVVWG